MSSAIDRAVRQRELLVKGMQRAYMRRDESQIMQLEHLLDTLDGLLSIVTFIETRH